MKLAKEIDWPDKLRIEGESVDADEKNTDGSKGPDEVFDEGEDTEERVMTLRTEKCEKSEVISWRKDLTSKTVRRSRRRPRWKELQNTKASLSGILTKAKEELASSVTSAAETAKVTQFLASEL